MDRSKGSMICKVLNVKRMLYKFRCWFGVQVCVGLSLQLQIKKKNSCPIS